MDRYRVFIIGAGVNDGFLFIILAKKGEANENRNYWCHGTRSKSFD